MKRISLTLSLFLLFTAQSVEANYTKNIEDEIKVYNVEKKVDDLILKYNVS